MVDNMPRKVVRRQAPKALIPKRSLYSLETYIFAEITDSATPGLRTEEDLEEFTALFYPGGVMHKEITRSYRDKIASLHQEDLDNPLPPSLTRRTVDFVREVMDSMYINVGGTRELVKRRWGTLDQAIRDDLDQGERSYLQNDETGLITFVASAQDNRRPELSIWGGLDYFEKERVLGITHEKLQLEVLSKYTGEQNPVPKYNIEDHHTWMVRDSDLRNTKATLLARDTQLQEKVEELGIITTTRERLEEANSELRKRPDASAVESVKTQLKQRYERNLNEKQAEVDRLTEEKGILEASIQETHDADVTATQELLALKAELRGTYSSDELVLAPREELLDKLRESGILDRHPEYGFTIGDLNMDNDEHYERVVRMLIAEDHVRLRQIAESVREDTSRQTAESLETTIRRTAIGRDATLTALFDPEHIDDPTVPPPVLPRVAQPAPPDLYGGGNTIVIDEDDPVMTSQDVQLKLPDLDKLEVRRTQLKDPEQDLLKAIAAGDHFVVAQYWRLMNLAIHAIGHDPTDIRVLLPGTVDLLIDHPGLPEEYNFDSFRGETSDYVMRGEDKVKVTLPTRELLRKKINEELERSPYFNVELGPGEPTEPVVQPEEAQGYEGTTFNETGAISPSVLPTFSPSDPIDPDIKKRIDGLIGAMDSPESADDSGPSVVPADIIIPDSVAAPSPVPGGEVGDLNVPHFPPLSVEDLTDYALKTGTFMANAVLNQRSLKVLHQIAKRPDVQEEVNAYLNSEEGQQETSALADVQSRGNMIRKLDQLQFPDSSTLSRKDASKRLTSLKTVVQNRMDEIQDIYTASVEEDLRNLYAIINGTQTPDIPKGVWEKNAARLGDLQFGIPKELTHQFIALNHMTDNYPTPAPSTQPKPRLVPKPSTLVTADIPADLVEQPSFDGIDGGVSVDYSHPDTPAHKEQQARDADLEGIMNQPDIVPSQAISSEVLDWLGSEQGQQVAGPTIESVMDRAKNYLESPQGVQDVTELKELNRRELDALALTRGVENPGRFRNKTQVGQHVVAFETAAQLQHDAVQRLYDEHHPTDSLDAFVDEGSNIDNSQRAADIEAQAKQFEFTGKPSRDLKKRLNAMASQFGIPKSGSLVDRGRLVANRIRMEGGLNEVDYESR